MHFAFLFDWQDKTLNKTVWYLYLCVLVYTNCLHFMLVYWNFKLAFWKKKKSWLMVATMDVGEKWRGISAVQPDRIDGLTPA